MPPSPPTQTKKHKVLHFFIVSLLQLLHRYIVWNDFVTIIFLLKYLVYFDKLPDPFLEIQHKIHFLEIHEPWIKLTFFQLALEFWTHDRVLKISKTRALILLFVAWDEQNSSLTRVHIF
jgi:hypothetical protein